MPETQSEILASMNEKLDKILKYQRSVRRMAILRGFMSFCIFMIFVVAPLVGGWYFLKNVNFEEVKKQFTGAQEALKNISGEAGAFKGLSLDGIMKDLTGKTELPAGAPANPDSQSAPAKPSKPGSPKSPAINY